MDADRREVQRAFAASPGDVSLARRLVAALVRDGLAGEVEALAEAKYLCPASWESLGTGFERACKTCGDLVRLALDERETLVRLAAGHAAAIPVGARALVLEALLADRRFHVAQERRVARLHLDHTRSSDAQRSGFHELFEAVESYRGESLTDVVLEPRLAGCRLEVFARSAFRRRRWAEDRRSEARLQDLWELHSLLRVSDALLGRALRGDGIDLPEYLAFFETIGLTKLASERAFSPAHHEIVAVESATDAVAVTGESWPGLAWGDLIFTRAGVSVRAPRALVDPDVAVGSTLFFSFRRESRPCEDLSSGWGSSSQWLDQANWRTTLPRFYDECGLLLFNVDENRELGPDWKPTGPGEPPLERQREILLHRSCVRAPEVNDAGSVLFQRMAVRDEGRGPLWPLDPELVVPLPEAPLPR